jgi:hypothetical protein
MVVRMQRRRLIRPSRSCTRSPAAERFRYHWDAGNYAYNILRTCT